MIRRLAFIIAALLSLLLSVAGGFAWWASHRHPLDGLLLYSQTDPAVEVWRFPGRASTGRPDHLGSVTWRAWWLRSRSGRIEVSRQEALIGWPFILTSALPTYVVTAGDHLMVDAWVDETAPPRNLRERLGFRHLRMEGERSFERRNGETVLTRVEVDYWTIPHWLIVLLGVPLPMAWLWCNRRSRRWQRRGLCAGCGYDIRMSPERCPECGRTATEH